MVTNVYEEKKEMKNDKTKQRWFYQMKQSNKLCIASDRILFSLTSCRKVKFNSHDHTSFSLLKVLLSLATTKIYYRNVLFSKS